MKITKATYGDRDCLSQVRSRIVNNRLIIRADNNIIGDPKVNTVKYLEVSGEIDGVQFNKKIREGNLLTLPKLETNKLGIFYSNNNKPKISTAIDKSLDTINIASKDKVDIITCVWNHIPNNPFHEIKSWYTSQSHLNQLLQIMQ